MARYTKTAIELYGKLLTIKDDADYAEDVMEYLETDEERLEILNCINTEKNIKENEILLMALRIYLKRKKIL